MAQRTIDAAAIEAEVDHIRSLGIDALRARWRTLFGAVPPKGLTKHMIGRMIAYRIQKEAGGLDRETVKVLDRLARGGKPDDLNRRLKPGTVLVREYKGERHIVTVVPDGFLWRDTTYSSLSIIAQAITGTKWNGPRFFGLRVPSHPNDADAAKASRSQKQPKPAKRSRSSVRASDHRGGRTSCPAGTAHSSPSRQGRCYCRLQGRSVDPLTFRMLVVVLNDCVTETNDTECRSNNSTSLAKSTNVEAVSEKMGEGADAEPYAAATLPGRKSLATGANSLAIQIFRQVSDRPQLQITPENQPHSFGFLWDDDEFFVDAGIAQRN
jgi:hypothetical protein